MNQEPAQKIQLLLKRHHKRQHGLECCIETLKLVNAIQQHRGCSLAILGGDRFFESRLVGIQKTAIQRLQQVGDFSFVDADQKRALSLSWLTIRQQWRQDTPMENFQLHTHLVDQCLRLVMQMASAAGLFDLESEDQALLRFALEGLPRLMEVIAQSRGLAVHCTLHGVAESEFRTRLDFLRQQLHECRESADASLLKCSQPVFQAVAREQARFRCEQGFHDYIQVLDDQKNNDKRAEYSADDLFTRASQLISAYWMVVLSVRRILGRCVEPELRDWMQASPYS